jgi:hypothetical protein
MGTLPQTLEREAHVDLRGQHREQWLRRGVLLIVLGFVVAGLVGVFGQRGVEDRVTGAAATFEVEAPGALRSGLMYQARFEVVARERITTPILVLDDGWFDGTTINSLEPSPVAELERNGHVLLVYDPLDAGERLTIYMEPQVNPTTTGERSQDVALNDGGRVLARVERSVTVFP